MRIPHSPPPFDTLINEAMKADTFLDIISRTSADALDTQYYHWDQIRFRQPPEGLTHQQWWLGLKFKRRSRRHEIPLTDTKGKTFGFVLPDLVAELLHHIDRDGGTLIQLPEERQANDRA